MAAGSGIEVIKRIAYGYRGTAYFFLKIRAAFPGKKHDAPKKDRQ